MDIKEKIDKKIQDEVKEKENTTNPDVTCMQVMKLYWNSYTHTHARTALKSSVFICETAHLLNALTSEQLNEKQNKKSTDKRSADV